MNSAKEYNMIVLESVTVWVGCEMDSYLGGVGVKVILPDRYPEYVNISTAGLVLYPAVRMLLVVHVMVVSALIVPEVVTSEGLFSAPDGGARVKEAVLFHQFWFSVGFWLDV